jgi:hypothetical protein
MNYLERITFDALAEEYGQIWETTEEDIIVIKLKESMKLYSISSDMFRCTPSAYNYNLLQVSMLTLQYWHQKKAYIFTVEAEF